MKRCQLDLGGSEADHWLTAPALFAKSKVGVLNPALLEKEFDACRYLVLSSSGPEFPPTLQGIWGAIWQASWSGDSCASCHYRGIMVIFWQKSQNKDIFCLVRHQDTSTAARIASV
ncbi:MAG: hypothetical protein NTW21_03145 [Verrucomicrobia bacterium]|nr:hypothetical protein [Verrucomicrobiota bacterium]